MKRDEVFAMMQDALRVELDELRQRIQDLRHIAETAQLGKMNDD